MQLGMIGLGRMGSNMVRRLLRGGHECVVYDINPDAVAALEREGALGATTLADFVSKLTVPRAAWVMVPAAFVDDTVSRLAPLLDSGDTIIDGGNSYYREAVHRSEALAGSGIQFVDVGTSGGVLGLERGYCLMIGGSREAVSRLEPVFTTLAPGITAAARTPGRVAEPPVPAEQGWLHCGTNGAGHFVKMVHNGIEYGVMAAYAEGLAILRNADVGLETPHHDAETAPLIDAKYYQYDIDVADVAEVWRRGSVITSWLLDLTAEALHRDPSLESYSGRVSDSGEGRWTVMAAIDEGVPAHVITASLFARFSSRGEGIFANQVLSAMRKAFGGHVEKDDPAAQTTTPKQEGTQ